VKRVLLTLLVALGHPSRHGRYGCWTDAMRPSENMPSIRFLYARRNRAKDEATFRPPLGKGCP
jgi:hypothetical protein